VRKSALVGWLLLAPSLLLLGGLVVFPVLYNVWLSLFDKHAFMPVQAFVGLRHYRYFASDPEFWTSFYYGSVYAGVTMVLQLGVGVPAASAWAEKLSPVPSKSAAAGFALSLIPTLS